MTIDTSKEAVERLLQDVTPGPWYRDAWDIRASSPGTGAICEVARPNGDDDQYWKSGEADANARFIAAALELVPALLKERDALRADLIAALQRELVQMQRADEAEAKLVKAVGALVQIATDEHPLGWTAIAALKEINGENHD